jgi:type IV secretion system protein TrbD
MTGLRRTPLHRALHRPNLFLGGERELVLITAIICGGVAVSALNLVAIAVGAGVWLVVIGLFRLMAKADPQMSRIYLRQIGYRPYYPARSRPARGGLTCWR